MPETCRVCGRPLKNRESIKAGIGETCRMKTEGPKIRAAGKSRFPSAKPSVCQMPLFDAAPVAKPPIRAVTVVRRPSYCPVLPFEIDVITYPGGPDAAGEHYWAANGHVAGVIGDLEDNPHRKWVIETLNAAVIANASRSGAA
jgi:hypothetical protein